jgi:hypothetical protein
LPGKIAGDGFDFLRLEPMGDRSINRSIALRRCPPRKAMISAVM